MKPKNNPQDATEVVDPLDELENLGVESIDEEIPHPAVIQSDDIYEEVDTVDVDPETLESDDSLDIEVSDEEDKTKFDPANLPMPAKIGIIAILLIIVAVITIQQFGGDSENVAHTPSPNKTTNPQVAAASNAVNDNTESADPFGNLDKLTGNEEPNVIDSNAEVDVWGDVQEQVSVALPASTKDNFATSRDASDTTNTSMMPDKSSEQIVIAENAATMPNEIVEKIDVMQETIDRLLAQNNTLSETLRGVNNRLAVTEKRVRSLSRGTISRPTQTTKAKSVKRPEMEVIRIINPGTCITCSNQAILKFASNPEKEAEIITDGDTVLGLYTVRIKGQSVKLVSKNDQFTYNASKREL